MRLRWVALVAAVLLAPSLVDRAYATPPPGVAHVVRLLTSERGVEGARCTAGGVRDGAPTYLCTVKVRSGCVSALFQIRQGQLGWYRQSARRVKCPRSEGGPTS